MQVFVHLLFFNLSQCSWCSLPATLTSVEFQCPGCAQCVHGFAGVVQINPGMQGFNFKLFWSVVFLISSNLCFFPTGT